MKPKEPFPFTKEQLQWIEALESGVYEQAREVLKRFGGYCCLGVLCDLFKEKVEGFWDNEGDYSLFRYKDPGGRRESEEGELPIGLQVALKLYNSDGAPNHDGPRLLSLAGANDKGHTFKQIAERLRKYPHRYFTNLD